MASFHDSSRLAIQSRRGRSGGILLGALLACGVIAGSAWAVVSTFEALQQAASTLATEYKAPVALSAGTAGAGDETRIVRIAKFSRLSPPSESEQRQSELTAEAIQVSHQRGIAIRLAAAVKREKAKAERIERAIARAERSVIEERAISGEPALLTALAEPVSAREDVGARPFDSVMAKPETSEEMILGRIPLPETRPALEAVVVEEKPTRAKPATQSAARSSKPKTEDVAYAKPDRTLFGTLFGGGRNGDSSAGGWPGKGTKVAIYDVSGATVHMPDGTKLRAHSGIGKMRDNPKYSHVKMKGPTPAGIYRLRMRERRFHGVEAIRMLSIDGRDPQNRTGLLTHTNLLRGQIGSHGCVAFQNYEPFLNAFKRGHVDTLVVVPQMPNSRTQIAALYRKAA